MGKNFLKCITIDTTVNSFTYSYISSCCGQVKYNTRHPHAPNTPKTKGDGVDISFVRDETWHGQQYRPTEKKKLWNYIWI